jgi:signal transduction histidine kinase
MHQRKMHLNDAKIAAMALQQQLDLFKASAETEERERERIFRNLHDYINPMLQVLRQNLDKHHVDFRKGNFQALSFQNDYVIIDKVTEGIRTSSYELVPSYMLNHGFVKSLEDHLRIINEAGNVAATFSASPEAAALSLPKQEQLHIYRASLEIINNTIKHAECTVLELSIEKKQERLVFEFSHNGKGVSNEEIRTATESSKGLGLKSLNARILLLAGTINYICGEEISSIILSVPVPNDQNH